MTYIINCKFHTKKIAIFLSFNTLLQCEVITDKVFMTKITGQNANYTAQKKDILKDTPIRALGYMDDIGAASRPLVEGAKSGLLRSFPSIAYIPAAAYITTNVVDKFRKGDDGTGEKPSVKAGFREALYQGAVNILAPMAIVKGVSKTAKAVPKLLSKLPEGILEQGKKAFNAINSNKIGAKAVKISGKVGKVAVFATSLYALAKLSKPIDKTVEKIMEKTVDPLLKSNKKTKAEKE